MVRRLRINAIVKLNWDAVPNWDSVSPLEPSLRGVNRICRSGGGFIVGLDAQLKQIFLDLAFLRG
jgi:hypothetical protein